MVMNMKVLQINSVYGFGSTGKIVGNIHDHLLKQGIDSYVIYARKEPKDVNMQNVYRIYSPLGTAMHAAFAVLFDTHGLHSRHTTKKIIQKIKEIDPDVIHLHVIHGFYLNYPMLFSFLKQYHKKVVWTLHDCWEYTGYCAYYDYNQCLGWQNDNCAKCRFRNTYPYRIFSHSKQNYKIKKACYDNLDITLASCSQWLDKEVGKSMLKDKRHLVINNSVDLSHFYYQENDLRSVYNLEHKKIVLAVANVWTKPKGFEEILKLAQKLDEKFCVVMIGLSKKQLNNLPKNIIGFSRLGIDELRKWYSTADVFVNCTLEDNYPTVNLEAKACGLPIITYKTGGSPEMVGENGYVVERYDIEKMVDIIKNEDLKRKVELFTTNMAEEYLKLYNNI